MGFNPNKRAEKREGTEIPVGDKKFRARRKTNSVMRAFRRLSRSDDELERQLAAKGRELRLLDPEWVKLQQEFKADQITDLDSAAPDALREQLAKEFEEFVSRSGDLAAKEAAELSTERESVEDEIAKLVDARETLLFESIACLLKDGEQDDGKVDAEYLIDQLDTVDAQALLAWLLGEDEKADPTTPTTSAPAPA